MDVWDASDGFVGGRLCATTLGGRHFEGVQFRIEENGEYCTIKRAMVGAKTEKNHE